MQKIGELIQQLASASQHFAEQWGGPGLMLIAFVDSSFFTLPEVADLLVVVFTIKEPDRWLYWAAMTTLGSLLGCSVLYTLARAGGRALVRSGFHERHLDRVLEWFRRHGALVLVIPALLPPPMPFKLFVFTAGVAGVRPLPFVCAIVAGRGLRYGLAAWLARRYGDGVFEFIKHEGARLIWPVLGIGAAVAIAYWWYRWRAK